MPHPVTLSEPTPPPGTSRTARTTVPPGIGLVLNVLRLLISYACHIAAKAEECAVRGDLSPVNPSFGKSITFEALIIRVARGLRRALMLQEMLLERAATGCDIEPVERRHHPHAGGSRNGGQDGDKPPKVERLPSGEEIAAELQRRSIGAIVADICHDIGIAPEDITTEQWHALQDVINGYGGALLKLWPAMRNRIEARMAVVMVDPNAVMPNLPCFPRDSKAAQYAVQRAAAQRSARPP